MLSVVVNGAAVDHVDPEVAEGSSTSQSKRRRKHTSEAARLITAVLLGLTVTLALIRGVITYS
jgi:hypothetical protein